METKTKFALTFVSGYLTATLVVGITVLMN